MPFLKPKLVIAWSWFFVLLLSYYILKPLRDGTASILSDQLDFWYLTTFIFIILTMTIYSRLVGRLSPFGLTCVVYQFFAACILAFAAFVSNKSSLPNWCIGPFFVWVSVFNVCSVALFWSIVTDICTKNEAKQWFGILAGAGSLGAIVGSFLTWIFGKPLGQSGLLVVSFIGLECNFLLSWMFLHRYRIPKSVQIQLESSVEITQMKTLEPAKSAQVHSSGESLPPTSLWKGFLRVWSSPYLLGICLFVLFGKFVATFIYNNLQILMEAEIATPGERTGVFAQMNVVVQIASAIFQYLIVAWLIQHIGLKKVLALPSLAIICVFVAIFFNASLNTLIAAQVIQQVIGYGLVGPSQNILFTIVPRQDKYVAKGFIDTFVFRLSDFLSSKASSLLRWTQFELSTISIALVPVLIAWVWTSVRLGKQFENGDTPSANTTLS
jgi:ATP:ADP antiporter, AAA family